jgi:hypothetical protein
MPFSIAIGGSGDEKAEQQVYADLKKLVEKYKGVVQYARFSGSAGIIHLTAEGEISQAQLDQGATR